VQQAWPAFRDFCMTYRDVIVELLCTRRVQTNEVRRCSYLLPAFSLVHSREPKQPLAIIEIGASGGLNLNWDRYAYNYAGCGQVGKLASPVVIRSEWRGPPMALGGIPLVIHRVGIDLHPVDVHDVDQALWLQSLLWPDQPERFQLLCAAIDDFRQAPVPLVAGDALVKLQGQIDQAPNDSHLCIVHSHTLNQFTEAQRAELTQQVRAASFHRPIHVISAEWIRTPTTELHWTQWHGGENTDALLGRVDHHGRWIEWLA
jgi:hypothetical protein